MPGPERTRRSRDAERPPGRRRSPAQGNKDVADRDASAQHLRKEEVSSLLSLSREQRAEAMMELQRRYGNRRVQRMLARLAQPEAAEVSSSLPAQSVAQAADEDRQDDPNQVGPEVVARIEEQQGSGRPLDQQTRDEMEPSFGQDFSDVRVHTGSEADALNQDVQARAFTTGKDIFFREGTYAPGSSEGKELLAHELTHVVQQSGASAAASGPAQVTSPNDATEVEAAKVAEAVIHQGEVGRQEEEEEPMQMARQAVEEEEEVMAARQETRGSPIQLTSEIQRQEPISTGLAAAVAWTSIGSAGFSMAAAGLTNEGDISYSFDEMEGTKFPNDDKETYRTLHKHSITSGRKVLDLWVGTEGSKKAGIKFAINYEYDGYSISGISMSLLDTYDWPFWGATYRVNITPMAQLSGEGAQVRITVNCQWTKTFSGGGSSGEYILNATNNLMEVRSQLFGGPV